MNELQQKLARRRSLNGEVSSEGSKLIQPQIIVNASKNVVSNAEEFKKKDESMATNELQLKLARRRSWEREGYSQQPVNGAEGNHSEDINNDQSNSDSLINSYTEREEGNKRCTCAAIINDVVPDHLEGGAEETEPNDSSEESNINDTDDTEGECAESGAMLTAQSVPLKEEIETTVTTTDQPMEEQVIVLPSMEVAAALNQEHEIAGETATEEQFKDEENTQEKEEIHLDEPLCDQITEVVNIRDSSALENGVNDNDLLETVPLENVGELDIASNDNIEASPSMNVSDSVETNAINDALKTEEAIELKTPYLENRSSETNSAFDELEEIPQITAWHAGKYQPRLSISNAGVTKVQPNNPSNSDEQVAPITPAGPSATTDTSTVASSSKKWNPPLLMARDVANAHYQDFLSGGASTVAQQSIDKQRLRSNSASSGVTEGTSSYHSDALTPIINGNENDGEAFTEADPIDLIASPPTAQRSILTAELDDIMKLDLDLELDIDNLDIDLEGEIARSRISSTASKGSHITEAIDSKESEKSNKDTDDDLLAEPRPISTRRFGAAAARSYMSYSSSNGSEGDGDLFDDSTFSAVTRGGHRGTMYYLGLDDDKAMEDESQIDNDAVSQSLYGLLSDTKHAESSSGGEHRHQQLGLVDHKYLSRSYINSTPLRAGLDIIDRTDNKNELSGSAGDADVHHNATDEPKPDMQSKLDRHGLFGNSNAISPSTLRVNIAKGEETNAANSDGASTAGDGNQLTSPQHVALFTEDTKPAANNNSDHKAMEYQEFLRRFRRCLNLVEHTKKFLFSVLGPNGDTTPPNKGRKLNYVFYGLYKLEERCRSFFDQMQEFIQNHQEFKDEDEERILCARDGLEQYVMYRIGDFAFRYTVEQRESLDDDLFLQRRMKLLSFLTLETLDIKPETFNETLLSIASEELRKINAYKTPGDKIACVVKSAAVIFRSLSLAKTQSDVDKGDSSANSDSTPAGADDFLPLFIWVVLKSQVPRLYSNCEYIQAYLNPARLMSKSGYCLINLRSAIEFVMYIDAESLNIEADEFNQKLAAAEKSLSEKEQRAGH